MMVKDTKGKIFDVCIYLAGCMGILLPGVLAGMLVISLTELEWAGGIVGGLLFVFQLYFLPKIHEL